MASAAVAPAPKTLKHAASLAAITPASALPGEDLVIQLAQGKRTQTPWLKFWANKYSIAYESLPIIGSAIVIRVLLEYLSGSGPGEFDNNPATAPAFSASSSTQAKNAASAGYIQIGDISSVLSGGIFLVGFMLNGVIADYKEAEKLPGEIAVVLAGLEDALMWGVPLKRKDQELYTPAAVRTEMLVLVNIIFKWLSTKTECRNDDVVHNALTRLWASYANPMAEVGPPVAVYVTQQVTRLRLAITRIGIISSSTYLPAGYAVVEAFCFLALSLVICGRYSNQASGYGVIIGTSVLYGAMLHLLRDIDNPFEYEAIPEDTVTHSQSGSTEIDLGCLLDYRRLLCARIEEDPAGQVIISRSASRRSVEGGASSSGSDAAVPIA
jgi:hypothetical protein